MKNKNRKQQTKKPHFFYGSKKRMCNRKINSEYFENEYKMYKKNSASQHLRQSTTRL